MNRFNYSKVQLYQEVAITALRVYREKKDFSVAYAAYGLFLNKFMKQLKLVTELTYQHETEVIDKIQCTLDLLPKDNRRELKKKIRIHFRN